MTLLTLLLGGMTLLVLLPVTVLFAEVLLSMTHRDDMVVEEGERGRLVVVVPAHDEASIIAETLHSILPQLAVSDRLLVVADNCSDDTATIVAAEGAEVIVRTNPKQRGKSYALDFAIRHLECDRPDVVIIIDADCNVATGSIDRLARLCARTARPAQALYLMRAPKNALITTRIGEFAWTVRNQVRPAGLRQLGLPCQLMGTGMAFPWSCISTATLASGHIAEDLILGIDLARAGTPPLFCPGALVTSRFPTSSAGIQSQRTRWEHGHLGVILGEAPRMFLDSLVSTNPNLMALALDLTVPPLALLTLLVGAVWIASAALYVLARAHFPIVISSVAGALLALSVLLSWIAYGRQIISLGELAFAGVYALWKIPLYARFLVARQSDWVRSKRDGEERGPGA
jgi:cellulose synthase/poly-beta-1,6-N-acetylglucosamine synthase-like glycosyltransferase